MTHYVLLTSLFHPQSYDYFSDTLLAAVIGREFSYELLRGVSPLPEDQLQSALEKLAGAELIYSRGIAPEAQYQFKHALIQDAAYEALLKSRRGELHRRVAQTLTDKFVATAEAQPQLLARHWTGAGEAEPAIAAWQKAGEAADARSARTKGGRGRFQTGARHADHAAGIAGA
jgi:predicted ATPase